MPYRETQHDAEMRAQAVADEYGEACEVWRLEDGGYAVRLIQHRDDFNGRPSVTRVAVVSPSERARRNRWRA